MQSSSELNRTEVVRELRDSSVLPGAGRARGDLVTSALRSLREYLSI